MSQLTLGTATDVLQCHLYLSDWSRSKIVRINEKNVTDPEDVTGRIYPRPMGLKVFNREKQFEGMHPYSV